MMLNSRHQVSMLILYLYSADESYFVIDEKQGVGSTNSFILNYFWAQIVMSEI